MIVFFTTIDVVAPDIYHYIQYHLFGFPNGRGKKRRRRREEENWGYLWLHLAVGKRANVTFHLPARAVSLILFIETLWPIDDVICLLEPD